MRSFVSKSIAVVALLCASRPTVGLAQSSGGLTLKAAGGPSTLTDTHSTAHILVTGTKGGQPGTYTCLPNKGCTIRQGYTNVSSKLVFDPAHETLTSCSPASAPGECTSASGIVTARVDVKMGKLRVVAKAAPGYGGLPLDTVGRNANLVFAEGGTKRWPTSITQSGFGSFKTYQAVRAGSYSVVIDPLTKHCKASQFAPVDVTVPEGDSQTSVDVLFKGNDCTVTVTREGSSPGFGGAVVSEPAGLTCAADGTGTCTGVFPFGTLLTLSPEPSGGATGYAFPIGEGCVPVNAPCTKEVTRDATFEVIFNAGTIADAGGADAATPDDAGDDSGAPSGADGGDASAGANAGASSDDASAPQDASPQAPSPSVDDGSCATSRVGHGATTFGLVPSALVALGLLARRRRRR